MKLAKRQNGFSAVELVLVLGVIGVLVFVGYTFYTHNKDSDQLGGNTTTSTTQKAPAAPAINSTNDLTTAENTLDQTDVDDNTADLDAELATF